MAIDKVVPVKQESAATGGNPLDDDEHGSAPANVNQDALEARGYYIQNDTLRDTQVLISRDASNNMTFTDGVVTGVKTLTDLLAGGGGGSYDPNKQILEMDGSLVYIDDGDILMLV